MMKIHHIHFETVPSTNDWAKAHLSTFDVHALTVISADAQTAGRGQFGKKWHSPKGENLYASFCFFMREEKRDAALLTQLLAHTTSLLLKEMGLAAHIKWPNDLLVNQKKIGGILCEIHPTQHQLAVIMGMGLNVNMADTAHIDQPATSLYLETKKLWDIRHILEKLNMQFAKAVLEFLK